MYFDDRTYDNSLREALILRLQSQLDTDSTTLDRLVCAQTARKIHIIRNPKNAPIGYILQASISKFSLGLLNENCDHALQHYEYNEGRILYLLDVCIKPGDRKLGVHLLKELIKKHRVIVTCRRNRCHIYVRNNNRFIKRELGVSNECGDLKFSFLNKIGHR